jgi:hypothetical protein
MVTFWDVVTFFFVDNIHFVLEFIMIVWLIVVLMKKPVGVILLCLFAS